MSRKYNNRHEYDENSSQHAFALRKSRKLLEAYNLALKLYDENPNDEWIEKAYLWTLVDIVKQKISPDSPPIPLPTGDKQIYFDKILFINTDDEILLKQIQFLKPKLSINYGEIQQAETLSKNDKHSESLELFRKIKNEGKLSSLHHESFGWAIYRYLNTNKDTLEIGEIKKLLFEYIKLSNKRPEILHSVILKFAISYSSKHQEFDLFKFFQLWGVKNLSDEDYKEQYNEDYSKKFDPTVERLIKGLADEDSQIDISHLQNILGDGVNVIDIVRKAIFWKLFNLNKEEKFSDLWTEFDNYASKYSKHGSSKWHSEILKIADRFMVDDNSNKFYIFFQKWGIENFQNDDWHDEKNGDFVNKPLVRRSLKKIFDFAKNIENQAEHYDWVMPLYQKSLKKFDMDIWLLREYATLLNVTGDEKHAINLYKTITLELGDQAYIWHEFSKLIKNSDNKVAISMLCKAITIQSNEDFLGDIHINLAKLLIDDDDLVQALHDLNAYKKHRDKMGWKISEEYNLLYEKVKDIKIENKKTFNFYKENLELAEDYLYIDIPWIDMIIYDQWDTDDGKKRVAISDFNDINFSINKHKFPLLKKSNINEIYQFKVHFDKSNDRYIPLKVQSSDLKKEDLIEKSKTAIAVVDHVNNDKKLFHYVINSDSDGIVKFSQTDIRPDIGDSIKVSFFETINKKQFKKKINILKILESNEINLSIVESVSGLLSLKYKTSDTTKPDFGFVDEYYVSKELLRKHNIEIDCFIDAEGMIINNKRSIFKIQNIKKGYLAVP